MASQYRIQVYDTQSGRVVASWLPGAEDEQDMIADIAERVRAQGVGVFRTEARVVAAVYQALADGLYAMKERVRS
jgi:hypothetical protein